MERCGHVGCGCSVEGGGYCSDHCREHGEHAGSDGHDCECGHADCRRDLVDEQVDESFPASDPPGNY